MYVHSCKGAELTGHLGGCRMAKMAGAAWKALSEQEKAPFKAQASADKQRHQQESACQALLQPSPTVGAVGAGFFCLVAQS